LRIGLRTWATTLILFILILGAFAVTPGARAQASGGLAQQYAPILHFASGEKFYPTSVNYIISSSSLMQRGSNGTSTLVTSSPTPSNLGSYNSSSYYLNNNLGTLDAIASDYNSKGVSGGYFAYVRIANLTGSTVIQYWLFYAYNNGPLNDHQSDLEVIEVFLDSAGNPTQVLYSQHLAGENAAWGDVETVGGHPVVYVALGSHANYFRSYQGRVGIENDVVNAGGLTITPDQLNLVVLRDPPNRPADQSWLAFPGRWGYTGTDTQIATGMAGPFGPVFNDNGQRWGAPEDYLARTLPVGSDYFYLAWFVANFLFIWLAYAGIRGIWKIVGIVRLHRKGGLGVGRFLKGRGATGLGIGLFGMLVTLAALYLPWYSVTASSQNGPFSGSAPIKLMSINGINGLSVNLFTGPNADTSSGLTSFASAQFPFAILFAVGLGLLLLDVVGVTSGKRLGRKFILGAIASLLPFVIIYAFIAYLPNLMPLASSLLGGQQIPPETSQLVGTIASNPVGGSAGQTFPVVGATTVAWGFGLGAYLFLLAAVVRIVAGMVMRSSPPLVQSTPPASSGSAAGPAAP
jgi:Vacuolar protein sorting-associated protein 62